VGAVKSKPINCGGNVLSANFFHVFHRTAPLFTAVRFALFTANNPQQRSELASTSLPRVVLPSKTAHGSARRSGG
jgi:hypothetical protein